MEGETTSLQVRPRRHCPDPPAYSHHSLFQPCPPPRFDRWLRFENTRHHPHILLVFPSHSSSTFLSPMRLMAFLRKAAPPPDLPIPTLGQWGHLALSSSPENVNSSVWGSGQCLQFPGVPWEFCFKFYLSCQSISSPWWLVQWAVSRSQIDGWESGAVCIVPCPAATRLARRHTANKLFRKDFTLQQFSVIVGLCCTE